MSHAFNILRQVERSVDLLRQRPSRLGSERDTMRFSDGVVDDIGICLTLALCVSCTSTWFKWRRDFKWLARNSQNRLHSGKRSNESFE